MDRQRGDRARGTVLLVLVITGLALLSSSICFESFRPYKVVDERYVIAYTDTSDYVKLMTASRWTAFFEATPGDLGIEEQRKMLHHLGYVVVLALAQRTASLVSVSGRDALFLVNPFLIAINSVLLTLYMARHRVPIGVNLSLGLLYVLSLSSWVYGSLPDSWVMSGTFVLLVLFLQDIDVRPSLIAAALGLFMLNNFTLLGVVAALAPAVARRTRTTRGTVLGLAALGLLTVGIWLGALCALSALQPRYRPDLFIAETLRFKHALPENLPLLSVPRWGYNFVNLFLVSVVCNQGELNFSSRAILDTARSLPFGLLGLLAWITVLGILFRRVVTGWTSTIRAEGVLGALRRPEAPPLAVVVVMTVIGGVTLYYESLLYSPAMLPALVLVLGLTWTPKTRGELTLRWLLVGLVLTNSFMQVDRFRALLGAL